MSGSSGAFRFGPFLLNPDTRELRRDGEPVSLPPKAFDTLRVLVEQRDRVLSKEELFEAVWPDVAVEDSSLTQQIFIVRRALEHDGDGDQYIATVPRRGYRFVADVRDVSTESLLPPSTGMGQVASARLGTKRAPASRRAFLLVIVLATALLAGRLTWKNVALSRVTKSSLSSTFLQVTTDPSIESFPSLSPDGSSVVYAAGPLDYDGESDLYLKSVSGRMAVNVTSGSPGADTQPAFSPNGQYIAFRSDREGGGLFVMKKMGDSVRRLTSFGFNPSWSPGGDRIAFSSQSVRADPAYRPVTPGQLWTVDVRTGETKQLGIGLQPSWSPHGRRIAFLDDSRIWSARQDGTDRQPLTPSSYVSWNPVWAPAGNRLYFCSNRGGTMNVWRVAIDEEKGTATADPEAVTAPSTSVAHLSFSADGHRFAFASVPATVNLRHYEFDPDTERIVREDPPLTTGSWDTVFPEPSPDGEWIAFHSGPWREDIWIVRRDGSGLRQITDDEARDRVAQWSPDGRRISFYSTRDGAVRTWVIDADGSNARPVSSAQTRSLSMIWSPSLAGDQAVISEPGVRTYVFDPRRPVENQTVRNLPRIYPGGTLFHPTSWSPDGRKIAGTRAASAGAFVFSLADETYIEVTTVGRHPRWLRDGRRLIVCDRSRLLLVDTMTGRVKEVLSLDPDRIEGPAGGSFGISRDSRHIYVCPLHRQGDIWLATLRE